MSEFLVVIPEGWLSFTWEQAFSHPLMNPDAVKLWRDSGQISYLSQLLIESGLLPEGSEVVDVKMIDDTYFFIKLA